MNSDQRAEEQTVHDHKALQELTQRPFFNGSYQKEKYGASMGISSVRTPCGDRYGSYSKSYTRMRFALVNNLLITNGKAT